MIREIKEYLKNVVLETTDIPAEYIYFSLAEANQYNVPPFCKIITEKSTIKEVWEQEKRYDDTNIKLLTRKYSINVPILIGFAEQDEATIDHYVYSFLKKLKRYIKIDNQAVFLNPVAIEYSDSLSIMSAYVGVVEIEALYGVYEETEFDRLTKINEEIEYYR